MSDPLAQFRKKPIGTGAEKSPPPGGDEYVAFDAKDKVDRLKINRANHPTRSPGYAYLLDVVYDGQFGTNFVLIYTFMAILVRGKNLQGVVTGLQMGTVDFIQEFDPERWALPKDDKAPFIESVEVVVQQSGPSIAESENPNNTVH